MIILIGGNGFLGKHIRDRLRTVHHRALIVSRHQSPTTEKEEYVSAEIFKTVAGDALLRQADAIIYLASQSVPSTFAEQPEKEVFANVEPATAFFSRCARLPVRGRLVLISSGGTVYGNAGCIPIPEDTQLAPVSAYGMGKVMIEEALRFVGRSYGLRYGILRVSNPVGKYQTGHAQGLISIALRCLELGKALPFMGDGDQVRDYVDADDVASAILKTCFLGEQLSHRTWNVGSGVGHSVRSVIDIIEHITGKHLQLVRIPERPFDVKHIVLDVGRINRELPWFSRYSLEESIERVWRVKGGDS
jgi:UDP-glucose 4-epimerase